MTGSAKDATMGDIKKSAAATSDSFFSLPEKNEKEVVEEEEEFKDETVDEKRVRLAKMYLEKLAVLEKEEELSREEEEVDKIDQILQNEAFAEKSGRGYKFLVIADKIGASPTAKDIKVIHGQKLCVTSLALADDDSVFYSASKDGSIVKWDVKTMKKIFTFKSAKKNSTQPGHLGPVYSIALTSDGGLLASGGNDKKIKLWDTKTHQLVDTFIGHRDKVTGVAFQVGTRKLYSTSFDRAVKVWNCDTRAYLETLYGHTAAPHSLHALRRDRCITCGYDRSIRMWKIQEETQLVFTSKEVGASMDCVFMVTEEIWITGSQDGSLALWNIQKKKPLHVIKHAHGFDSLTPHWISAIAALPFSDIIATGSCSGSINLWKMVNSRELHFVKSIPLEGWINALQFSKSGRFLIAGVGKDQRFGRWGVSKNAKNGVALVPLQ
uniref:Uncharacterized protein n=1 Tax=Arcella intermedia TaxID=1963864 RepID=A0A6B2L488_9EUKA